MQDTIQLQKLEKPSLDKVVPFNSEPGKIRLGEYPYTYVRTTVMRTLLIKPEQYDRLLKMSVAEIIRYLEETEYKKEIDQLALQFSGSELIEQALTKNLVKTFEKLRRISNESLLKVINIYLMRKDIHNLKTIFRGNFTKTPTKDIESVLVPVGLLDTNTLSNLLKIESIEELARKKEVSEILPQKYLKQHLESFRHSKDIGKLENAMDHFYFRLLQDFVLRLGSQGRLFKEFIETELEILNIMTILRLKREGISKAEIRKILIQPDDKRAQRKLLYLLDSPTLDSVIEKLKKFGYKEILNSGLEEYKKSLTLTSLEMCFKRHLLHKTLLFEHKNPLSVDTILSYMFAKDMEVRNLSILLKCKQFGFDEDFIKKQLVI